METLSFKTEITYCLSSIEDESGDVLIDRAV